MIFSNEQIIKVISIGCLWLVEHAFDMCVMFLFRVACVEGRYPEVLLDEWDAYHHRKGSENDRPGEELWVTRGRGLIYGDHIHTITGQVRNYG